MRIVQIIDSLEPGGSERMAVNYANVLAGKIDFSGLIVTRKEGLLLDQIDEKVSCLFLKKKKTIDFKAVFKLRKYIKSNKIDVIHTHSSSFFIAVLVKLTLLKVKIIWHDHYGISQDLSSRKNIGLKLGSLFFSGSIAVNSALKVWAETYLWCPEVVYFPNFIENISDSDEKMVLKGSDGKRIICVANLRLQKNHKLLIEVANIIRDRYPDWTFHLFGKDFEDSYSRDLKKLVNDLKLRETIFFYGAVNNVRLALKQSEIAVLPSLSEGLPLAILEYGLYKLPVVATNVGEIPKVITSEQMGIIVEPDDLINFTKSIQKLIENKEYRLKIGSNLYENIVLNFSEQSIIKDYIFWLDSMFNSALKTAQK